MNVTIFKDRDELQEALAETICNISQEAIATRGEFNFVLSGGSSPQHLYKLLSSNAYKDKIDWKHTYFFFGDERFVAEDDPQRNSLMAKRFLFDFLKIPAAHIVKVDTSGTPLEAAQKYAKTIELHFKNNPIHFDLVLLGMGDDGHTASLFPYATVLKETEATVKSVYVEKLNMDRITMTAPLINQSRNVAFLVFGEEKSQALYHVIQDSKASSQKYPAKLIQPKNGKLTWFLDAKAGSLLTHSIK